MGTLPSIPMHHSSSHDLVVALNILASEIQSEDGVSNTVCFEASIRIQQLIALTKELSDHILASPIHHPKCNAKTKGTYCNCILSRITPNQ
jgi:hypothetical protein